MKTKEPKQVLPWFFLKKFFIFLKHFDPLISIIFRSTKKLLGFLWDRKLYVLCDVSSGGTVYIYDRVGDTYKRRYAW